MRSLLRMEDFTAARSPMRLRASYRKRINQHTVLKVGHALAVMKPLATALNLWKKRF